MFGRRRGKIRAIPLIIAFLVVVPTGTFLKDLVDRQQILSTTANDSTKEIQTNKSFPSSHTSLVIADFTVFILESRITRIYNVILILLLIEGSLVLFSRVLSCVHYRLDIIGGMSLGSMIRVIGSIPRKFYKDMS